MKTLKIQGKEFRYEKDVDRAWGDDVYTYSLYDENGNRIAFEISTFRGVREIAKAYLTGNKEELFLAKLDNCY